MESNWTLQSPSGLIQSFSQCVAIEKVAMDFIHIDESVFMQPLMEMLSGMTELTHLKFANQYLVSSDISFDFEQKKFCCVRNLKLDLHQTKVIFHLTDYFTFFKLNRSKNSHFLQLEGPGKNYSVRGY